jgi:hypothetical protein
MWKACEDRTSQSRHWHFEEYWKFVQEWRAEWTIMIIPCIVHPAQLCGCGHDVLPDKTILKNKQRNDGFEGGKLLGL